MSTVLRAQNLQTYYGKSHILHGIDLYVDGGEVVTLLGRNGAGKTTTLRSIMGLTTPLEGSVELFGNNVVGWPAHKIARTGVGYVPEGRKIFGHLTVEENLKVPADTGGRWNISTIYELFPRLGERRRSKGARLSGGEQEMLAIARALLLNPKLLILDEPSQGLAPLIVEDVMRTIRTMRDEGIAVLFVEQNAVVALKNADRAYVLSNGRIIHSGPASELASDEQRIRELAGATGAASA